jgi:hypothetical protein
VGERVSVLDAYRTCDCPTVASCADNGAYTSQAWRAKCISEFPYQLFSSVIFVAGLYVNKPRLWLNVGD